MLTYDVIRSLYLFSLSPNLGCEKVDMSSVGIESRKHDIMRLDLFSFKLFVYYPEAR